MPLHRPRQVSAGHPLVRRYLQVKHQNPAEQPVPVAIEGTFMLARAVAAGASIEVVFICPERLRGGDWLSFVPGGASAVQVSGRVLTRMVDRDGPDGIAAIARLPRFELADVRVTTPMRIVVIDAPDLPGNVGAIVRCADGAGAAAVVVNDARLRLTHPQLVRATMGTIFSTPLITASGTATRRWLRAHNFHVVAADPNGRRSYRDVSYTAKVAIVVGNERTGLSAMWRQVAGELVAIPMAGLADSLNVGHAAALLLYEALYEQEPP